LNTQAINIDVLQILKSLKIIFFENINYLFSILFK